MLRGPLLALVLCVVPEVATPAWVVNPIVEIEAELQAEFRRNFEEEMQHLGYFCSRESMSTHEVAVSTTTAVFLEPQETTPPTHARVGIIHIAPGAIPGVWGALAVVVMLAGPDPIPLDERLMEVFAHDAALQLAPRLVWVKRRCASA